jgi:hypothetical protein
MQPNRRRPIGGIADRARVETAHGEAENCVSEQQAAEMAGAQVG